MHMYPYLILDILFQCFSFLAPKDFNNYFALQSFDKEHHLMKVIPETYRKH